MDIKIRQGTYDDVEKLGDLYDSLNDFLGATTNYPGWRKGVYPTVQDAKEGVDGKELYVADFKEEIAGTLILRRRQDEAYLNAPWQQPLDDKKVLVIHTFAVNPKYLKLGIGKILLDFAVDFCAQQDLKAIRLDVYEGNFPAISLYKKCGFSYISTVSLGLEEYGLDNFKLFEKLI